MSSWTIWASGALPVSTSTSPSPVRNDETLAKEGQNPTPSVISTNPPTCSTGWNVDVESSPFQRRSATDRTSEAMLFPLGVRSQKRPNEERVTGDGPGGPPVQLPV